MDATRTRWKVIVGIAIMLLLQIFLSPIISINSIVPNFLISFTLACVISRPDQNHLLLAFFSGILYDLFSNGPVGAMAFVVTLIAFIVSKVLNKLENINLVVSLFAIILSTFCTELIYGLIQLSLNVGVTSFEMFAFKVIPCTFYDSILGIIVFAIMVRLLAPPSVTRNNPEKINSRW